MCDLFFVVGGVFEGFYDVVYDCVIVGEDCGVL